ncbi:MAG: M1 family metallopeptidase [Acidimicrobiales bacterium]
MPRPHRDSDRADVDHRLPRAVVPRRYELTVEPDLDAATFTGTEAVATDIAETVTEVVLNAADLEIGEAWLAGPRGSRIPATPVLDPGAERLTLALDRPAGPGSWTVHLGFSGTLNDKLRGFYRSVFTDDAGTTRVIGATQMEPTDARRAFPCWDEPDRKAVFSVTLVVPEGLLAVSNTPVVGRIPTGDGRVAVAFADTIPMSTYLVAFVVGPLEATEAVDVDGVAVRVVHVPGKAHLTGYALELAAFCLRHLSRYYDLPYPGEKCDLIALPDFAAGAMENLGAITFREALVLADPGSVTQAERQRVADVVAHELAHMWFGDLVTMAWWNGLWLNEAFATFMELAAVDAFEPAWQRWVTFTTERSAAFEVDALTTTRPVEYPVRTPDDAEGMFDVLTYQKGASVLRMLEQYLGPEAFRAGIRRYLANRRYGNAETTDLWDAIEEATGEPVRRIMDSWIFQPGHPEVAVSRGGDGRVTLGQRRFLLTGSDGEGAPAATWSVPVLVGPAGGRPVRVLLEGATVELDLPAGPLVVNAGGHGFYRVRYDEALLGALRGDLDLLAPVERALLVEDTWAAVLAGDTPGPSFLDLAGGFGGEGHPAVWATLVAALVEVDRILDGQARGRFGAFVGALAGPALDRLGWAPVGAEDHLTRQLRGTIIATVGRLGRDPGVVARAREAHAAHLEDGDAVDPNVAAASVRVIATAGSEDDYAAFLERYRTSPSPQESLRYLHALADFPGPELARRTLAMALTDDVRSQNAPFLLRDLLANREVNALAWAFVTEHWDALTARFPDNAIPRMLGGITALSTPELAAVVEAFLDRHPVPQGARTVAQHRERLRVNVALRAREAGRLAASLAGD